MKRNCFVLFILVPLIVACPLRSKEKTTSPKPSSQTVPQASDWPTNVALQTFVQAPEPLFEREIPLVESAIRGLEKIEPQDSPAVKVLRVRFNEKKILAAPKSLHVNQGALINGKGGKGACIGGAIDWANESIILSPEVLRKGDEVARLTVLYRAGAWLAAGENQSLQKAIAVLEDTVEAQRRWSWWFEYNYDASTKSDITQRSFLRRMVLELSDARFVQTFYAISLAKGHKEFDPSLILLNFDKTIYSVLSPDEIESVYHEKYAKQESDFSSGSDILQSEDRKDDRKVRRSRK
jgi:hypothetical protein